MSYKKTNDEYQTPQVDILLLHPEGVLCASGETDDYTLDDMLNW